jgi:thiol-disulfide isomerase/thioredoxin
VYAAHPQTLYFAGCKTFDHTMNRGIILIITFVLFISCKEEKQINIEKLKETIEVEKRDSLSISINMPANSFTGLNVWLEPYDEFYLEFKNKSENDSIIVKNLPLLYNNYQMKFGTFSYNKNNDFIMTNKHFIANQEYPDIELKLDSTIIAYIKNQPHNTLTDSIYNSYRNLGTKYFKNKNLKNSELEKELDSINTFFKDLTTSQKLNSQINEMLYLDKIQNSNPKDKRIKEFLEKSEEILTGSAQSALLYNYFKNNVETLNYEELNTNKYTSTYIELLAIGAYRFLKFEDNKGDTRYNKAVSWLKTTDFYKRDSTHVKKQITPLSNENFKKHLSKLILLDLDGKQISISKIISQNKTQYYLIDFWATWCAPCIKGVKTMNEMNIPKNVKVISFSVDKEKDKEKWKLKTKELKQELTYWLNEQKPENKGFTEFIEMQSIPRYVLIDKNMNLIDQAFYHPQELQFLSKLKDIKNNKYW